MKKLILIFIATAMAAGFSACKKDDDNGGNDTPAQKTCVLKSVKEVETNGTTKTYDGFMLYYNTDNKIIRANQLDTATGDEDSTNYALFSYNGSNLASITAFQQSTQLLKFNFVYNAKGMVTRRSTETQLPFKVDQTYFYDTDGKLSYSIQTVEVSFMGQVIKGKDSAVYQGYNSFGRPTGIIVYITSVDDQGNESPYQYDEEYKYEYDAKGNRTKTSYRDDVNDSFEEVASATFNQEKTVGDAEIAFRLLELLDGDDWANPNLNGTDFDLNLPISETTVEDGVSVTTFTNYTFTAEGNPATSKETTATGDITTSYIYDCK